jgi:hypothetical protein
MITVPMAAFWGLALFGLFQRDARFLIYLLFACFSFGTLAVIPTTMTGGLSILAASMTAMLLYAKILTRPAALNRLVSNALSLRRLGLLTLFWLVTVVVTLFAPHIFAGQIDVSPMKGERFMQVSPVEPTNQNLSQLLYITLSIVGVFVFTEICGTAAMRQTCLKALCLGALVLLISGVIDMASQYVPLEPLLEQFRTAEYAYMTADEVLNLKRIVGLHSEASAFGAMNVYFAPALYFLRHAFDDPTYRRVYAPALIGGCVVFAIMSTSSASYVGVAVFGAVAGADWLLRAGGFLGARAGSAVRWEALLAAVALLVVALTILVRPQLFDPAVEMVDQLIFQKSGSSSFEERTFWTDMALSAAIESGGIGVGAGTARSSNQLVAVIAGSGFLGAALYVAFLLQTFLRPTRTAAARYIVHGVRCAYAPAFAVGFLVGTIMDFGLPAAFTFGLATAAAIADNARRAPGGAASPASGPAGVAGLRPAERR